MSTAPQYFLAIDNGTQSIRTLVFDKQGNEIAKARVVLEAYFSTQAGFAEQHADYYWEKLCEACQKLWQTGKVTPQQIMGVSITTQRYTMICLDEHKQPIRPAIVWMDQRKATITPAIKSRLGLLRPVINMIGLGELVADVQAKARCNWLAEHEPDNWKKTKHYVNLSGYLTYKLTGELKDSAGQMVGYLPYDYKVQDWCKPSDVKWKLVSCKREQLPKLAHAGERIGSISSTAAEQTGIIANLPVIAAASDKACEVLGCGGVSADTACMSFGTTATINTCTPKYSEVVKHIPPYTAAIPKHYNTEFMVYRGFWMVSWFKEEFAHYEAELAKNQGVDVEHLLDEAVQNIPAGSMGLIMQPYWSPGVRQPGIEGKGSLIGFGDVHGRAHVYRAILEGLAYELRQGFDKIEKRTGTKVKHLRVAGGGSQSNAAMQLTADIFNLPAVRPHTYEASGLGAAINCAVGVGVYKDYTEAVANMTRLGDVFEPIADNVKLYKRLYNEVYLEMYDRMKPLYASIRDITGYPS